MEDVADLGGYLRGEQQGRRELTMRCNGRKSLHLTMGPFADVEPLVREFFITLWQTMAKKAKQQKCNAYSYP